MNYVLVQKNNYEDFTDVLPFTEMSNRNRYTIGAYDDDGMVAGAISFALFDDQYEVDWLYVIPPMREMGVATGLFNEIHRYISGTGEIYPIRAEFEVTEEDMSLLGFFLSRNEMDTGFSHYRFYVSPMDMAESEGLKLPAGTELTCKKYFSLPTMYQNRYLSIITADHNFLIEDRNKWKGECIPELCKVACDGDKLMGAMFIMGRADGNLELSYFYSTTPIATKILAINVASQISANYPEAKLIFDCVGDKALPLAQRLFPYAEKVCIYESVW